MSEEYKYPTGEELRQKKMAWDSRKIRELREHLGLTQSQMADELQVRQQTISEWETGMHKPHRSTQRILTIVAERAGFYHVEREYTPTDGAEEQTEPEKPEKPEKPKRSKRSKKTEDT